MSLGPITERRRLGDRFVVEREVGRGGAGIVYRAYDLTSQQTVALKVIAADAGVAPDEEARFTREGQLLENLDHPGIVKTVGFGVLDESGLPSPWRWSGWTAKIWLRAKSASRSPFPQSVELTINVAEALDAAHSSRA